jgi:hypothetical protein
LEGWLHKQGKKNPTIQHKRWFRREGEYLSFFIHPNDLRASGQIGNSLFEIIIIIIIIIFRSC